VTDGQLEAATLRDGERIPLSFLFLFLGAAPNTDWLGGTVEFQRVATNQPTRVSVPRATAEACHLDRDAATKNATAPSSTNEPSPIETPRS
jgi:hypothetical protein